ncbi:hypothetical protein AZI87_02905 [Bdellovibrio bacteriovorus]|uniref:Uncharacterized protein n=1 Tax=Bdellovibrio bacteriovorus TaxID=959 RepID=A0A162GIC9_BDEBC|nr:hypothetical protein [Bdellovibrio bacteriovorus]KYG68222.1 hypothetical protein AZI87_02905 [Bdellovibrio bacteriovorus]
MFIDVVRPEAWEELNDQVKAALGLEPKARARSFAGIASAVFEISQSTAQFMSHKKAIGVILGQTSVFEGLLPYYYKETYEVAALSHLKLHDVKEWVENLKKETCFVLFAEDHPVTGEIFPFADELDKLLNEKRIFSFRVSHARHFQESITIRPYTVRLCSYAPSVAVAIVGERFRSPAMMAQNMSWQAEAFIKELTEARGEHQSNPLLVENFEKEISAVARLYFSAEATRLFDRAVFSFSDVSAEAVADNLFKKLGISKVEGWQKMASTNMCHWSAIKMFRHWWEPTPSLEQLRGLLIVGLELLNTKDFAKLVISSYEEVKLQQSWDV